MRKHPQETKTSRYQRSKGEKTTSEVVKERAKMTTETPLRTVVVVVLMLQTLVACERNDVPLMERRITEQRLVHVFQASDFASGKIPYPVIADGLWTPDDSDILRAHSDLLGQIDKILRRAEQDQRSYIKQNIHKYRTQYLGIIVGGRKMIHMNFVSPHDIDEEGLASGWREMYVLVHDGGSDFWRVNYDLKSRHFKDLRINDSP